MPHEPYGGFQFLKHGSQYSQMLQLTLDCLLSLRASRKTGSHSRSSYRLLASSSCIRSAQKTFGQQKPNIFNKMFKDMF